MRLIKTGIINIDTTVGAFGQNAEKIFEYAKKAADEGCTIAVFSEQTFAGYPSEDLVQWSGYVRGQWQEMKKFAEKTSTLPTIFVLGITAEKDGELYNCAVVVAQGKILGVVPKEKLPTYGVFYEQRTFSSGAPGLVDEVEGIPFGDIIFRFSEFTLAAEVCEDLWSPDGPMRRRVFSGADVVANISSSPWRAGILSTRKEVISTRAGDNLSAVIYANQVGGNDSLVFDGGGFVNQCGKMLYTAPRWSEGYFAAQIDLDRIKQARYENTTWRTDRKKFLEANKKTHAIECNDINIAEDKNEAYKPPASKSFFMPPAGTENPREEYFNDLIEAMVMGLAGYFEKAKAFERIGIALSGGKDSAITLLIARIYAERRFESLSQKEKQDAIKDFIHCFSLPTRFNSYETKSIARTLAEDCGVTFIEVPIEEQFSKQKELLDGMLKNSSVTDITLGNIQARIRGSAMWNWVNEANALWIQTGNMSEKAVGYTTIGGDMMGGYSLIGNLPKTVVSELIKYLGENVFTEFESIPRLLKTKASAELAEDQEDEDELMPFDVLDTCYALFVGEKMMPHEVYKVLCDMYSGEYTKKQLKEWVRLFTKKFRASIFKWVQAPQTVHLGSLDLDRERALQLPVVQSAEWLVMNKLDKA